MSSLRLASSFAAAALVVFAGQAHAQTNITRWNFNTDSFTPQTGAGTITTFALPGATAPTLLFDGGGAGGQPTGSSDTATTNRALRMNGNSPAGAATGDRGAEFRTSTVGFNAVTFSWDQRHSSTSARWMGVWYSTDAGVTYTAGPVFEAITGDAWTNGRVFDLSAIPAANNAPDLRIRVAPAHTPGTSPSAFSAATIGGVFGVGGNTYRLDLVTFAGAPQSATPITATAALSPTAACNTGGSVQLIVAVTPGLNPASTSVLVTANLTAIGGGSSVTLTSPNNDNTYVGNFNVPPGTSTGPKNIAISISDAQSRTASISTALTVAPCDVASIAPIVIAEVFGGGSQAGPPAAPFNADYAVLFNRAGFAVDLSGYSLQYSSNTNVAGFDSVNNFVALQGVIDPGSYYLIAFGQPGTIGSSLPTPDVTIPIGRGGASTTSGRFALVNGLGLAGSNCAGPTIFDLVSYGTTICWEGAGSGPAGATNLAVARKQSGAQDSNQNFNDLITQSPNPRNRASGDRLSSSLSLTESAICNSSPTVLGVNVTQAPTSTNIAVTADLSQLGQSAATPIAFGPNGYEITITPAPGTPSGNKRIRVTTADAQGRTSISDTILLTAGECASSTAPVVISAIFGGGNNAGALWNCDLVELFNRSQNPVDISNWSLQYASATGASVSSVIPLSTLASLATIPAGGYRTLRMSTAGTANGLTPSVDAVAVPLTSMDNNFARLALVDNITNIGNNFGAASVIDFVGYGINSLNFEGTGPTPTIDNTTWVVRKQGGCQDTNNNNVDFYFEPTGLARTSTDPINVCAIVPPAACLADVASDSLDTTRNPNNSVGSEDLDAFIAGFIADNATISDVASDSLDTAFNPNGSVGSEDLDAFIASFIAGC